MKKFLPLYLLLLMAYGVQAQNAPAANLGITEIDPAATALIEQSAQAYAKLTSLSMFFTAYTQPKRYEPRMTSGTLLLENPDKARLEYKIGQRKMILISDGNQQLAQTRSGKSFTSTLKPGEGFHVVLDNMPSSMASYLHTLATGKWTGRGKQLITRKAKLIPDNGVELTLKVEGFTDIIEVLYFDPTDHLLRRVEARGTYKGNSFLEITTLTSVQINPVLPPEAFKIDLRW